jgi:cardiolipin synthase
MMSFDQTSGSVWTYLYLASEWLIRFGMLVIVPFRRSPEAAKGWLLFGFFLPWPALVAYYLIGRPSYPAWRRKKFSHVGSVLSEAAARISAVTTRHPPDLPPNLAQAATLIENLGRFPTVAGNDVDLIAGYEEAIGALIADIDRARSHVHLLTYIFADDETGRRVIAALAQAVRRGTECRVLIDAIGSRPWLSRVREALTSAGVEVHIVLPLGFLRRRAVRADLRNHRKMTVIDGEIGYVGSQNIVDATFMPGIENRELVARVRGPVVLELQAVFAADWFLETDEVLDRCAYFPAPGDQGDIVAQVLPSGPDYPDAGIENLITALVHGARSRIVVTTPYFIPSEPLLDALETAVLRGVTVDLVLSRPIDHVLVNLAQRSYYAQLLEMGVRIRLYRSKLLHAKHISVDDTVSLIGSSNIDIRSFVLNSEVSLVVFDRTVTARLRKVEEQCFAASDEIDLKQWRERSLATKAVENIARLVSPLL